MRGRQVLANVIRPDRQLAVAAIDDHRQADRRRPAVVGQGIEGSAHRPPGEQHVVDEHHRAAADLRHGVGALDDGGVGQRRQVVAVEGDVERADWQAHPFVLLDQARQSPRQRDAAAADAHQDEILRSAVALHDFVGNAGQRAAQVIGIQDLRVAHAERV